MTIPFDINFDDKKVEDAIQKAFFDTAPRREAFAKGKDGDDAYAKALEEHQKKIKGLVEEYKKWRDLQRDVLKNDVANFGKLLSGAQDFESQVAQIRIALAIQMESLDALLNEGVITQEQYEKAVNAAKQGASSKEFKLGNDYIQLMNYSIGLTASKIKSAADAVKDNLNKDLDAGVISAQQYAEEIAKIEKISRDFEAGGLFGKNNDLTAYLTGGLQGLMNRKLDQLSSKRVELANKGLSAEDIERDKEVIKLKATIEKIENFQNSLSSAAFVIDAVTGVLDGLGQAAQSLSEMFDALGNEGAANTWGDIADTISGIASVLTPANNMVQNAMNGNVSGLVSSAISAPVQMITGPITSFAKLHDKRRERQIEELRKDVQKIDNTLNLIKNLRDRTLGYDSGILRRQLAAQYNSQRRTYNGAGGISLDLTPAASAMYEYYSRGGLSGSGYKQELDALKKQREDYQKMYDVENGKKKKSKESLEEYKSKMAELDIQIMNFTQDLANELWGIDLKGWADQISDALMTAFENGEDAAEAFNDTVQDIMRQVLRKMLSLGVIQPMMERLQKKLFGENGKGGVFDVNNPEGTINDAMKVIAEFFGEGGEGRQAIDATEAFYNGWNDVMKSVGLALDDTSSSSSTGKSIQGVTEQTADLLASYMNASRADVSVNRTMISQYFPMFYTALTNGNTYLVNIENHTAAIMRSNDAIAEKITSLDDNFRGLRNKTWSIPIA